MLDYNCPFIELLWIHLSDTTGPNDEVYGCKKGFNKRYQRKPNCSKFCSERCFYHETYKYQSLEDKLIVLGW